MVPLAKITFNFKKMANVYIINLLNDFVVNKINNVYLFNFVEKNYRIHFLHNPKVKSIF